MDALLFALSFEVVLLQMRILREYQYLSNFSHFFWKTLLLNGDKNVILNGDHRVFMYFLMYKQISDFHRHLVILRHKIK